MKNIYSFISEKLKINSDTIKNTTESNPSDPNTWRIGDIVYTSWGYNMTIVDYYEIIKRTGKGFTFRKLKDKIVSGNGFQGKSVPLEGEYENDKEIKCRINKWGSVRIEDSTAHLWDGEPIYYDHLD